MCKLENEARLYGKVTPSMRAHTPATSRRSELSLQRSPRLRRRKAVSEPSPAVKAKTALDAPMRSALV
jgi:hypothetical protein